MVSPSGGQGVNHENARDTYAAAYHNGGGPRMSGAH